MTAYISISGGLLIFSVVTLALGAYGRRRDTVKRRLSDVIGGSKDLDPLREELNKSLSERFVLPLIKALSAKISPKDSEAKKDDKKRLQLDKRKKMLRQAGLGVSVSEYSLIRVLVIAGFAAAAGIAGALLGFGIRSLLGVLIGIYAGYVVMRFHLTSRISNRRKALERQMPDVLDLLAVNVEAGLGFEQALLHVIGHFEGPLIDELTVTHREMTMGRSRRDALLLFAERCDLPEIKNFTGAVVQAEKLGISIKNVLRTQATAIRVSRRNKGEEKAMKISVKILLPMVGLIFPVLLIVLMGPAAVKIIRQFMG
jgi:tight adherence protein C